MAKAVNIHKRKRRAGRRKIKRIADRGKPIVRVPPVAPPIQIQLALASVAVEIRDVAIAVRVLPHGTNVRKAIRATVL